MAIRADLIGTSNPAGAEVDFDRDRHLVLRFQKGDDEAFDELYQRYFGRVRAYCYRRVGNRHVAEELAQEAFVRALRAMPRFAGQRRFYPWMTVIAQRLCIDHHRRAGRTEPTADVDLGSVEPEHDLLFDAVDRDQLVEAMERLAPRHREVLALREQEAWTYQQIADHLAVPLTTVEALLHRARKALRREFHAISGTGRALGALPVAGLLAAAVGRLRLRVGRIAETGWLPQAVGPAAAGVAAVGLALGPLSPLPAPAGRPPAVETLTATPTVVAEPTVATAPVGVPAAAAAASTPPGASQVAASSVPTPTAPPPAIDLAVVEVSHGPAAVAAADASNAEQPLQVDLGLLRFGLDPVQIIRDVLEPGIGGTP